MAIGKIDLTNARKTFIMHTTSIKQAYAFYDMAKTKEDFEKCAEFCIAAMETALVGDNSSTNPMIKIMLEGDSETAKSNIQKWQTAKEESRMKTHFYEIAEMYRDGMRQDDIAREFEISQSRVSQILAQIKVEEPQLLGNIS